MNFVNFLCRRLVLLSVVVFGVVACGSDPASVAGGNTISTLSGTAATGLPLYPATITILGANGATVTTITDVNGLYNQDVSNLIPPYLLRVADPISGSGYIYSVATSAGTANIHPFTDLIIRNWYQVQGVDVGNIFDGTATATPPTPIGINTIEAVISNILATSMANAGLPANFNLLTSPFPANSTGFDQVLDITNVAITATGSVSVTATDPTSGSTSTLVSTTLTTAAVVQADTESPALNLDSVVAIPASTSSIILFWGGAFSDNVGIAGYNIYKDGNPTAVGSSPFPGFTSTGLSSGVSSCYEIEAFDLAGNPSVKTTSVCETPAAPSAAPPAAPTSLVASVPVPVLQGQIDLTWIASTDTVVGYDIYRNGVKVAVANGTSYSDTGLAANTLYSYTVKARNASSVSVDSTSASATTAAGRPSAPTGVTAVAANAQVTISWSPVNGATSYNVYMGTASGFSKISVTPDPIASSPLVKTTLTNGTPYFFVVTAVNASGESIESARVQATPTAPSANATLVDIQAQVAVFNNLFSTSLPAADNLTLVALFAPSFLEGGSNRSTFLTDITTNNAPGLAITVQALVGPKDVGAVVNDATHQWFTFTCTRCGNQTITWLAIKEVTSGKWQMAGNQRIVGTQVNSGGQQVIQGGITSMFRKIHIAIDNAAVIIPAQGITSITIAGPGIKNAAGNAGPAIYFDGTTNLTNLFSLNQCGLGPFNQTAITVNCIDVATAAAGNYTFTVIGSSNNVAFTHTYVETLTVLPPAILTADMFPTGIIMPTLASLVPNAAVSVNWTLPSGYNTADGGNMQASSATGLLFSNLKGVNSVNGLSVTTSFTLPTVFSNTGVAEDNWVNISANDANGLNFDTNINRNINDAVTPTPAPTPISGLVGSWTLSGSTAGVLTFFANGDYMLARSGIVVSPVAQPGLEHGTYTSNSVTGEVTFACPTVDTNGAAGISTPPCTTPTVVSISVIGNSMTIADPTGPLTLSRVVVDPNNALVGSWAFSGDTSFELTFFANGDYVQAQSTPIPATPTEQPGLEHGTYTWNSATGVFTAACPTVDTNLQSGFSAASVIGVQCTPGSTALSATVTVNGNTMTLVDTTGSLITFSRVN